MRTPVGSGRSKRGVEEEKKEEEHMSSSNEDWEEKAKEFADDFPPNSSGRIIVDGKTISWSSLEKKDEKIYQRVLQPLPQLPSLQTEPQPELWTVLKFLYKFDQMANNSLLTGDYRKRYFVKAIRGPT